MKKLLLLIAFLSWSFCLWAQQNRSSNNVYKSTNATLVNQPRISDLNNTINPNREVLKKFQRTTLNTNSKKNNQDFSIHWYALENENNNAYWENVDCKNLIVELKKDILIESYVVKDFLIKNNLSKIVRSSKYPEIQNFFQFEVVGGNKSNVLQIIKNAKNYSFILYAEPCVIRQLNSFVPNDPKWNQQWGPNVIGTDSVWSYYTGGGSNTILAVIDNAVDWFHPDLYDNVWKGWDFANNDNDPTPDISTQEHGTHVTGTIGATLNNGVGISGIINDTVFFAKANDGGSNPNSIITAAVVDALNYISNYSQIRAVNMSFGGYSQSSAEEIAINNAWNNGKLLIAAAGNDYSPNPFYPAAFPNVISVSAVGVSATYDFTSASYSNYGSTIDLSAPGGETSTGFPIISTLPNNTYGGTDWQGTSMASPHVAGLAGIVFDMNPFLTNTQVRAILEQQVYDLGAAGWDQYFGSGMICAYCSYFEACNQLTANINTSGNLTFCDGGSVTLTCDYNDNVNYQWAKNGVNISGATSNIYTANQSGNYNLKLTTPGGCQATWNPFVVNVISIPPTPTISANGSTTICQGANVVLSAPAGYSWYTWSNGVNGSDTKDLTVTTTGSYSLHVANSNWCNSAESSPVWVEVNPVPPTPIISANGSTTICQGANVVLSVTAGYSWYTWSNGVNGSDTKDLTVTTTGSYSLHVANSNWCNSAESSPVWVQVNSIPPTPTISQNGNQLVSNATNGNQWYKNWSPISGETYSTFTPTNEGWYFVMVTINGCTSAPSNEMYILSVEEITTNNNFKVYPNPVNQTLYIETLKSNFKLKFEIYNSIGQLVYSSTIDKKAIVDISHFANGFYDLNIYEGQNNYTKRLIKE